VHNLTGRYGFAGTADVIAQLALQGNVKTLIRLFLAIGAVFWVGASMAAETRVIINLSEQRAYLIEHSTLISPIASGKPGWQTPTGNFTIFSKDIDHPCMDELEGLAQQPLLKFLTSSGMSGLVLALKRLHTAAQGIPKADGNRNSAEWHKV
jgi:L,D-transpeptidase catalytic domain